MPSLPRTSLTFKFSLVISACALLAFSAASASSQAAQQPAQPASAPAQQIAIGTHPAGPFELASAPPATGAATIPAPAIAPPPAAKPLDPVAERQQEILGESSELLALAAALNREVMTTRGDVLSMDVIRKAQTIEKLAHGVKEKMKVKARS